MALNRPETARTVLKKTRCSTDPSISTPASTTMSSETRGSTTFVLRMLATTPASVRPPCVLSSKSVHAVRAAFAALPAAHVTHSVPADWLLPTHLAHADRSPLGAVPGRHGRQAV
jgi:hypothetical protein